jgi:ribosome assembly protein 1
MVCTKLPAPCEITEEKAEKLMCSATERFDSLPSDTQKLKSVFMACSSDDDAPVIVFISKMFPVRLTELKYF